MAQDPKDKNEGRIRKAVSDRVHSETATPDPHEAKALATLMELLDSNDERVRLEAAQTLLNRKHSQAATPGVKDAVKKVAKKVI